MRARRLKLVCLPPLGAPTLPTPPNHVTDRVVAERSMLIKNLMEDLGDEAIVSPIPIPNVNDPVLRKVVEWCEHHRNDAAQSADDDNDNRKKTTDIDEWDQKFMQVDQEMLFEIILVSRSPSAIRPRCQ